MGTSRNIAALGWLTELRQGIQALDYELHAALRILAASGMDSEHMAALLAASARRDDLMALVIAYCKSRCCHSRPAYPALSQEQRGSGQLAARSLV